MTSFIIHVGIHAIACHIVSHIAMTVRWQNHEKNYKKSKKAKLTFVVRFLLLPGAVLMSAAFESVDLDAASDVESLLAAARFTRPILPLTLRSMILGLCALAHAISSGSMLACNISGGSPMRNTCIVGMGHIVTTQNSAATR